MSHPFSKIYRDVIAGAVILSVVGGMFFMFQPTITLAEVQGTASSDTPGKPASLEVADQLEGLPAQSFGCFSTAGGKDAFEGCAALLSYWFMKGGAWLALWASVGLNYVVMELVVNMGRVVGNIQGITIAWEVLRDVANVFLVFLTIFVGISTIVGASGFGSKQLLWKIIIAALFVNFSITLTKAVIDVSNLVAVATFQTIIDQHTPLNTKTQVGECAKTHLEGTTAQTNGCITVGIAGVFWSKMEVTKMFNMKDIKEQSNDTKNATDALVWVGLAGGLMFFTMAFVFGAAMMLLMIRFAILCILIIVSPLAFVMLVTGVGGEGRRWWSTLLNQAFFAPAMFLMWWIAYMMFSTLMGRVNTNGKTIAASAMGDMGAIGILTYFFIMIVILVASLVIAKQMGASGASMALNVGNRWVRNIAMAPVSATRATGRWAKDNTYGRGMEKISKVRTANIAKAMKKDADGNYVNTGSMAKMQRGLVKVGLHGAMQRGIENQAKGFRTRRDTQHAYEKTLADEGRKQDVSAMYRDAHVAGADPSKVASLSGNDLNELHDTIMKNVENAVHLSAGQIEAIMKSDKFTESEREKVRAAKYSREIAILNGTDVDDVTYTAMSSDERKKVDDNRKAKIAGLKNKDLDLLHGGLSANPSMAQHLSSDQLEHVLNKSDKFNDGERDKLRSGRFSKIEAELAKAKAGQTNTLEAELKKISEKEAELLGDTLLAEEKLIESMPQALVDKVTSSSQVSGARRAAIKTTRTNHLNALIAGPVGGKTIHDVLRDAKRSDVPKMGAPVRSHIQSRAQVLRSGGLDNQISIELDDHLTTHGRPASATEEQAIRRKVIASAVTNPDDRKILELDDYLNNPTVSATY